MPTRPPSKDAKHRSGRARRISAGEISDRIDASIAVSNTRLKQVEGDAFETQRIKGVLTGLELAKKVVLIQ